jgi:hypothetical protein
VRAFSTSMSGVGEAGIQNGMISREESKKLAEMAGAFQAAEGGSAGTHGNLAGQIPALYHGKNMTAKEAFQKEMHLYNILQPGGAEFTTGVNQYLKDVGPMVQGGVLTPERGMSLLSAFSVGNKEGAGTQTNQFIKATAGGIGRMKGVPMEGDSQKIGAYLRSVGADNTMDPETIGRLISADMTKAETQPGYGSALDYLGHHGYGNMDEKLAIMQFHGMVKSGQYETFAKAATDVPSVEGVQNQLKIMQEADPTAWKRRADVTADMKKVVNGAGAPEYYQSLKENVFNQKAAEPGSGFYGDVKDWQGDLWTGGRQKLDRAAMEWQQNESHRVGIAHPNDTFLGERNFLWGDDKSRGQAFYDQATKIKEAGGNAMPDMKQLIDLTAKSLETADAMRKIMESRLNPTPPTPPALPARAPANNRRP